MNKDKFLYQKNNIGIQRSLPSLQPFLVSSRNTPPYVSSFAAIFEPKKVQLPKTSKSKKVFLSTYKN